MRIAAAVMVAAAVVMLGCEGLTRDHSAVGLTPPGGQAVCAVNHNDEIRMLLGQACKACHAIGSNRPFFSTPESFEDLLAYDSRYVVPGKPDQSYLVQLLEGTAQGAYKQMPLGGDSFAALDKKGMTAISLQDVKAWIASLPPQNSRGTAPSPDSPTTRRLTAEELMLNMRRLLGLPENGVGHAGGVHLDMRASDASWLPREPWDEYQNHEDPSHFEALGGPSSLNYRPRTKQIAPAMLQLIVQMSQDWCSGAVGDGTNSALLKYAKGNSSSASDAAAIRKNIAYLRRRFLGNAGSDAEVDDLYSKVYLKYEPAGAKTAWTAVCAYLIRDPEFITL